VGNHASPRSLLALVEMLKASRKRQDLLEAFQGEGSEIGSALGKCLKPGCEPALRTLSSDANPYVRMWAVCALANRSPGHEQLLEELLLLALSQDDQELKFFSADAFAKSGASEQLSSGSVTKIAGFLSDRSLDTRQSAADMLGAVGNRAEPAIPALVNVVKATDGALPYAAEALGKIGPAARSAAPELRAALEKTELPGVEDAIRIALRRIEGVDTDDGVDP
jgi:HEAT repeat protein